MNTDTFSAWLMKQVNRKDVVGDIATDLVENGLFDSPEHTYERLRGHLIAINAFPNAFCALKRAHKEWRKQ